MHGNAIAVYNDKPPWIRILIAAIVGLALGWYAWRGVPQTIKAWTPPPRPAATAAP